MKSLFFCLFLVACVSTPKFDSHQYSTVVDIGTIAEKTYLCESKQQQQLLSFMLHEKVSWVSKYSSQLPNNKDIMIMFTVLGKEIDDFSALVNKDASATYCVEQLIFIRDQCTIIQHALGTTQR